MDLIQNIFVNIKDFFCNQIIESTDYICLVTGETEKSGPYQNSMYESNKSIDFVHGKSKFIEVLDEL
jgi:hypothetical protein